MHSRCKHYRNEEMAELAENIEYMKKNIICNIVIMV